MKRSLLIGAVLALVLGSGVASGQGGVRQETADSSQNQSPSRPRLGLRVDIRTRATDSIGAFVEAVQAGSPADQAGIRAGDIITKLDGQPVGSIADRRSAGLRLIRLTTRLKMNSPAEVELRRHQQRKTVEVVIPAELTFVFQGAPDKSGKPWSFQVQASGAQDSGGQRLLLLIASPFAAIETASLNTELGEYFGVSDGVLVIKCPPETGAKLRGGDVILSVNGRKPSDPGHFMGLLQAQAPTEPIQLAVLRHRKHLTLTLQLNSKDGE